MSGFLQDLRYGTRVLLRAPGPTLVALLALALGIGVNLTSFTSVNSMILHPLPFPHFERIMTIWETVAQSHTERYALAPANFLDWSRQTRAFEAVAAYQSWSANLTGVNEPARIEATRVTAGFFGVVGRQAAIGRTFTHDEEQTSRSHVIVVSDGFWRQYLAGSPRALGRSVSVNGETFTVVGVMPADFDFPLTSDLWAPLSLGLPEQSQRAQHTLNVIALLKPDVSVEWARTEAEQIARGLQAEYPKTNEARNFSVLPLRNVVNEVTQRFVLILLVSAALTLLLACANVANLQLARAANRGKEIAVRAALGATRYQVARQLFAESLLLAAVGSILALLLASWNLAFTKSTVPVEAFAFVAGLRTMRIDGYVAFYTVAICFVTALLCSLPAVLQLWQQGSRQDLNNGLKRGDRTSGAPGQNRLQSSLIVYEVAMALVLLVGAGFMVKMFNDVLTGRYGYDPNNLLEARVSLPATDYQQDKQVSNFYVRSLAELQGIPGAEAVALWSRGPLESLQIEGRPEPQPGDPQPGLQAVSEGFLAAMRIPLVRGRFIASYDQAHSAPVVVLSQSVAHSYWPHSDPIGQRVRLGASSPWLTVVGISGDIVQDWLNGRPSFSAYVPYQQHPLHYAQFMLRTAGEPAQAAPAMRSAIRKIDRNLPVYGLKTMARQMFEETSGIRAAANTMSTYAAVALLLAATGIFALISYSVARRTRDIGVRMALGADSTDVLRLTLDGAARLTFTGLFAGSILAFGLMKLLSSLLYNLVKLDLFTFLGCIVALAAAALMASYLPAYRATKIDPLVALRQD